MTQTTATVFPEFQIEDRTFTQVLLGHNPFLGYSYLSRARAAEYEARFASAGAMQEVMEAAIEAGVRGMVLSTGQERAQLIAEAIEGAERSTGVRLSTIVIVSPDWRDHLELLRRVECQVALIHGQVTDSLFFRSKRTFRPEMTELTKGLRAEGIVPAMSTHNGGETIPVAEKFDIAAILTPVNKLTWRMCPCVEMVLDAIEKSSKVCLAMKPLAMGRIPPQEGMDYALNVRGLQGVVVGIGTAAEATETFGAAKTTLGL